MTTRRRPSGRRTTRSGTSSSRTRPRTTAYPRRRRRSTPATTLGAAVGTVVVSFLVGAPWSVRITLVALVVVGVVGYVIWTRRR